MTGASRVGWTVLTALSALFAVNHVVCLFVVDDEQPWTFASLALVDVVALVILLGPYRRGKPAAWTALWVQTAVLASTVVWTGESVWTWYLAAAAVVACAQCTTLGGFRRARRSRA